MDVYAYLYYYLILQVLFILNMYMFLEAVVETAGDSLWQNEKIFVFNNYTQILIESDEYGRDAIVISVAGKTNMGDSKRSDHCCMTLKLLSE